MICHAVRCLRCLDQNFHNITFLARGRLIYNGPFQDVAGFFEGAGLKTPQGVNPADFYMRALQTDSQVCRRTEEAEAEEQIQQARLEAVGRAAEEMVQILGTALTEPTIREGAVVAQGGVEPPHQAEQAALAS